jgi:hypothetical protein
VVGQIAGDNDRVDRSPEVREVAHDPRGPVDAALPVVNVDVAVVRDDQHAGTVSAGLAGCRRPIRERWT